MRPSKSPNIIGEPPVTGLVGTITVVYDTVNQRRLISRLEAFQLERSDVDIIEEVDTTTFFETPTDEGLRGINAETEFAEDGENRSRYPVVADNIVAENCRRDSPAPTILVSVLLTRLCQGAEEDGHYRESGGVSHRCITPDRVFLIFKQHLSAARREKNTA